MRIEGHLIITTVVSSFIYFIFNSLLCAMASFLGGFFIDLDHLIDYAREKKPDRLLRHPISAGRELISWSTEHKFEYLTIILHSLELLFLLWILIAVYKLNKFWVALAIGLSQHIFVDMVFNRNIVKIPHFYFLSLRAVKRFRFRDFRVE